jgi:hypothetical protein
LPNLDLKLGIRSKNSKAGIFLSGKREGEGGDRDKLRNDQEIKFQEVRIGVFQEIENLFRRLKLCSGDQKFFFDQEVKIIVKLLGDQKSHFKF